MKKIITIAFEGESRSGKDTQLELVKNKLEDLGIPCVTIHGEGYRNGNGISESDPRSEYWEKMSVLLKENPSNYELWNKASYRLARELIIWRDKILTKNIEDSLKPFGVLLVNRSLVSNVILKSLEKKPSSEYRFNTDELYPKHLQNRSEIKTEMVLPDIIIEFIAPKDVLLSRLDQSNPEYEFKKDSIENKYNLYLEAKEYLPEEIKKTIVSIDSSKSQDEVFAEVIKKIKDKFPELEIKLK